MLPLKKNAPFKKYCEFGLFGKEILIPTSSEEDESSEEIRSETKKEAEELGEGEFEDWVVEGAGVGVGVGVGVEVLKIKDQILLQPLQLPLESLASTLQYQVPSDKEGV